jgi:outer membrane protein TolC
VPAGLAVAQESAPVLEQRDTVSEQHLTLEQALQLAEQRNPELLAAREKARAQASRSESLRRQLWPRAYASLNWSRSDAPAYVFSNKLNAGRLAQGDLALAALNAPGGLHHLASAFTLEAPVDLTGRIRDNALAHAATARAVAETAREALLETRFRATEAYRRAQLAERALQVMRLSVAAARAREAELSARVQEGAALEADRLRARARRRQREAELFERLAEREIAIAALARVLGVDASFRPVPAAEPAVRVAPLEGDETAWQARAQARPLLAAARESRRSSSRLRRSELRSSWPELGVYAQLQDDRGGFSRGAQSGTFGVVLRVSVFDGTRAKRLDAAAAEERAADAEARAAFDRVRFEVASAWRRAQAARQRFEAASGGAEEGREVLRVVRERRLSGLATLTDELETESAALTAELQELQALVGIALADAALRRAAGEI